MQLSCIISLCCACSYDEYATQASGALSWGGCHVRACTRSSCAVHNTGVCPIPTQWTQLMGEQEFMSGGSIDTRIWNQPLSSVTWKERVQWCKNTAEVWLNQPEQVVEWMLAGDGVCAPIRLCTVSCPLLLAQ